MSTQNPAWPEGILDIPIQDDLSLDTHSTAGEHATKEYSSWQLFNHLLESTGVDLSGRVEDPFAYYIQHGPGRFHRAYNEHGREMLVGMTTRPDDNKGRVVDSLVTVEDPSHVATAVREILRRNVFGEFAGIRPLPHTKRVTIPSMLTEQNLGVQRALYDFAVPREGSFVIPMPNIVTPQLDLDAEELEKAKNARPADFSGVIKYVVPEAPNTSVEEFYREGEFVGKITTVSPDEFIYQPDVSASDANGSPVEFGEHSHWGVERNICFLKTLAENDPQMAELILTAWPLD